MKCPASKAHAELNLLMSAQMRSGLRHKLEFASTLLAAGKCNFLIGFSARTFKQLANQKGCGCRWPADAKSLQVEGEGRMRKTEEEKSCFAASEQEMSCRCDHKSHVVPVWD